MSALESSVVAINDPKWPNALLVDEHHLGDIINFLNSNKEAINTEWGYECVKKYSKAIIAKEEEDRKSNVQMMPYNDLLIMENDDRNKAYSCCLECSLGFIDYSKQPDNNYKHVFVFQDDVTKFTILKPLKEKGSDEISHSLLEIFSLIGVPTKIYTREKLLVKSVFNKEIRNFSQNFQTKIKHSKNRTFEETECYRIDEEIKEWMKLTMSTKWSKGLYFIQFQNNCHFNEVINTTPFYALLKPSYTYSRRKYTRYLFRKRELNETLEAHFLKHPACISIREKKRTIKFLEKNTRPEMKEKEFSSLKKQDGRTKICKNDYLASKDCLEMLRNNGGMEMLNNKLLENEHKPDTCDDACERQEITNLEYRGEMEMLNDHYYYNKGNGKMCHNNPLIKYEMVEGIYGQVKDSKGISENKRFHLNKLTNSLSKELYEEERKKEFEENVNPLEQKIEFVNTLKNDCFAKAKAENCFKTESFQTKPLKDSLDNDLDSVNLWEEASECCKKRKCITGNDGLSMLENSTCHVLRLVENKKNTTKLKKDDNSFEIGNDLNKKHDDYDYEDTCSVKFDNKVTFRNENSKIYFKLTGGNSSKLDGYKCEQNNYLNIKKNHFTSHENRVKAESIRFLHDFRRKDQICLICKKKKRQKTGLNSLNKTSFTIGSTVQVRVPVTERLKGYPNYILATIIEEKDRMYKVVTPRGVLKEMFKRDQLRPCNSSILGTGRSSTIKAANTWKPLQCHPNVSVNKKLNKHNFQ